MMLLQINDYKVIDQIGEGGFGKVYLVNSLDEKPYALKLISVTKDNKDDAKKQAELYFTLDHPNILKAKQFFFFNNDKYLTIILQYCSQGTLANYIGKMTLDQCKLKFKQITQGLAYLHQKKIIHRDIKPENILIKDRIPKIADLGISKIISTSGASTKIGTQFYLAPQVFDEEKYDIKADIWSLGILLLEMLIGKRIYELIKGMRAPALKADFPSQGLLNQIPDSQIRQLVRTMLTRNSDYRPTAQKILDFLNEKIQKQIGKQQELISKLTIQQSKEETTSPIEHTVKYKFSEIKKSKQISLSKNKLKAIKIAKNLSHQLVLVEGIDIKNGSYIRFEIDTINKQNGGVNVGLCLSDITAGNLYTLPNSWNTDIGHGSYMIFNGGCSISHSHKSQNGHSTDFKFIQGDVINVKRSGNEVIWFNENTLQECRLKVKLNEEEWKRVCFCVDLFNVGDSVSII